MALGGVVAVLALMAGPASAQTSGGAIATDGSVASGDAHAANDSTASGDATAVNNSTASGCSTAVNDSTASGDGHCPDKDKDKDKKHDDGHKKVHGVGGGGAAARPAATTTARLALTGSWSVQLTALAALAVALGAVILVSDRRRATSRA